MITCILPCLGYPQKNFECPQFNPFKYYLPMPTVSGKKNQNWSGGTLFGGPPKFSPSKIIKTLGARQIGFHHSNFDFFS